MCLAGQGLRLRWPQVVPTPSPLTHTANPNPLHAARQVLGLQRSERLLPCREARRAMLRAAAEPALHGAFMADVYAGRCPGPAAATAAPAAAGSAAGPASTPASVSSQDSEPAEAPQPEGGSRAASQGGGQGAPAPGTDFPEAWALAEEDSEAALLLEASTYGAGDSPEQPG